MKQIFALICLVSFLMPLQSSAQEPLDNIAISGTIGTVEPDGTVRRIVGTRVNARRLSDNQSIATTQSLSEGRFTFTNDDIPTLDEPIVLEFLPPLDEDLAASALKLLSTEQARAMELDFQNIKKILTAGPGSSRQYRSVPDSDSEKKKELDKEVNQRMNRQISTLLEFEDIYSRQLLAGQDTEFDKEMREHIKNYLQGMPNVMDDMPVDACGYRIMIGNSSVRSLYRTKRGEIFRYFGVREKSNVTKKPCVIHCYPCCRLGCCYYHHPGSSWSCRPSYQYRCR